jgi:alpha-beta hydrolase superfamily lysophospholipase
MSPFQRLGMVVGIGSRSERSDPMRGTRRRVGAWIFAAAVASSAVFGALTRDAASQATFTEEKGTLPDGTLYLIRVPANWNGVLIRDLDYATGSNAPRWALLLEKGFAISGTGRHRLRLFRYDPQREIADLDRVLDLFEQRFRKPDRVIQYGCSGGGAVGLGLAEDFHRRIDGVIATAAHIPVWQLNTFLDGWFVLKALIAPELPIVDLGVEASGGDDHGTEGELPVKWRQAIDRAQSTPEGRARIALAFAIGQWTAWSGHRLTPQPKLDDVEAMQHSMYHTLFHNAENPGGEARIRKELAASGQQPSWNTDIDYRDFFNNGNPAIQQVVRQLYQQAGGDFEGDLAKINKFPRVTASPYAMEWWNQPGRTAKGNPKIPLLRMHEVGDQQVPLSLVQGYDDLVRANGKQDLYRLAIVDSPAHCNYTVAETMAAIETMMRRLDTGTWPSTEPEALNALGKAAHNSATRFIKIDPYAQKKYNRTWAPAASPAAAR